MDASKLTKKQKEALLSGMCKCHFESALSTEVDAKFIAVAIVSFAYGAGLAIPDNFKGYEDERKMLASILQRAMA